MAEIKQIMVGSTPFDIYDNGAVHDNQANYDNLKTKVDTLAYQNEWIGSHTSSATPPSIAFQTELTNFVKGNTTPSRDPRRGDEVTVTNLNAIYIYNSSNTWVFFSSNQQLSNATTSTAGIVKIGSGINVSDGTISATANSVGARPSNWMPTADEVGARPDTWMPTAAEVGARPSTWTPTKSDIGLGNVENKSSTTIRSEITSANVTSALGYTPYNSTNPNGYVTASGAALAAPVQSVNGSTGAVTVNEVPSDGENGQVLTWTNGAAGWAAAAGGGTKIYVSSQPPAGIQQNDFWYQVLP